MFRKITVKDLKIGDVYALEKKYLYPHVVTRIDNESWTNGMIRITFDWIDGDGDYLQDCAMVIGNETEIYRFII